MAEVKFSIKMEESKKAQLEAVAKENYRNLTGEINFAIDFYLNHIRATGATFIQIAPSSTQQNPMGDTNIPQSDSQVQPVANTNQYSEEVDEF